MFSVVIFFPSSPTHLFFQVTIPVLSIFCHKLLLPSFGVVQDEGPGVPAAAKTWTTFSYTKIQPGGTEWQ